MLSVVVTDSGSPSLSATQSFTVGVNRLHAPSVTQVTMVNGQTTLAMGGDFGPDYLVRASTNLSNWTTLFTTNSPALPFSWTDTNTAGLPRRFYRLQLGP